MRKLIAATVITVATIASGIAASPATAGTHGHHHKATTATAAAADTTVSVAEFCTVTTGERRVNVETTFGTGGTLLEKWMAGDDTWYQVQYPTDTGVGRVLVTYHQVGDGFKLLQAKSYRDATDTQVDVCATA